MLSAQSGPTFCGIFNAILTVIRVIGMIITCCSSGGGDCGGAGDCGDGGGGGIDGGVGST